MIEEYVCSFDPGEVVAVDTGREDCVWIGCAKLSRESVEGIVSQLQGWLAARKFARTEVPATRAE